MQNIYSKLIHVSTKKMIQQNGWAKFQSTGFTTPPFYWV